MSDTYRVQVQRKQDPYDCVIGYTMTFTFMEKFFFFFTIVKITLLDFIFLEQFLEKCLYNKISFIANYRNGAKVTEISPITLDSCPHTCIFLVFWKITYLLSFQLWAFQCPSLQTSCKYCYKKSPRHFWLFPGFIYWIRWAIFFFLSHHLAKPHLRHIWAAELHIIFKNGITGSDFYCIWFEILIDTDVFLKGFNKVYFYSE